MQFISKEGQASIDLFSGLRYIVRHQNYVLKSDGLDNYEYMYCKDGRGIYYEMML